jgi:hypothetical protein
MFGSRLLPHIQTEYFAYLSAFDSWGIPRVLCADSEAEINKLGGAFRHEVLASFRASDGAHVNAIYIDPCRHHTKCWSHMQVGSDES